MVEEQIRKHKLLKEQRNNQLEQEQLWAELKRVQQRLLKSYYEGREIERKLGDKNDQ